MLGIVCGLGDCIAQLLLKKEGSSKKYDLVRTARMSFIGFSFTVSGRTIWSALRAEVSGGRGRENNKNNLRLSSKH